MTKSERISNAQQKVNQKRFDEEFDRIFNKLNAKIKPPSKTGTVNKPRSEVKSAA